jgi:hypothetical protein
MTPQPILSLVVSPIDLNAVVNMMTDGGDETFEDSG